MMIQMRELTDTELDAVSGGAAALPIPLSYFSPQQANIPTQLAASYFGNVFQAMGPNINFNF
jgi:bacteriocin-like protein